MVMVRQSVMVAMPISMHITAITATDATLTASRKAAKSVELRTFFTRGFSRATNKKEGMKIPRVATSAP